MTLHQLRTFVAVAERGSVRGAAEQLVVSQPAVSAALRALQDSLGVALVEPAGRGVRLTAAGTVFARYAQRVLGLLEEGRLAAAGSDDPARGHVRIAAVTTASEHVMPRLLADFRHRYPDVGVELAVGNREQIWSWMARREVDAALAGRPPTGSDLVIRGLRHNELVMVAAPAIVPAGERLHLDALAARTWLLREQGSGTRATLEALMAGDAVDPPSLTLGSNGAVIAGAVAGLGVTLISRDAIERELDAGELVVIPTSVTPIERPWHAVTRREMTPTTRLFIDHLLDPADERCPAFLPGDDPADDGEAGSGPADAGD